MEAKTLLRKNDPKDFAARPRLVLNCSGRGPDMVF